MILVGCWFFVSIDVFYRRERDVYCLLNSSVWYFKTMSLTYLVGTLVTVNLHTTG